MENISFVDPNFLSCNPLNEDNIILYFSTSPFYDSSCNNEVLKMQSQYTGNKITQQVEKLKGIYYILDYKNPENTLFVIRKSENNGEEHSNLNFYYVIYGHIYEAPTDVSLYNSRTSEIFWLLNNLMDLVDLDFDPLSLKDSRIDEHKEDSGIGVIQDVFEVYRR